MCLHMCGLRTAFRSCLSSPHEFWGSLHSGLCGNHIFSHCSHLDSLLIDVIWNFLVVWFGLSAAGSFCLSVYSKVCLLLLKWEHFTALLHCCCCCSAAECRARAEWGAPPTTYMPVASLAGCLSFFWDRVWLYSPGWLLICNFGASASRVLELEAYTSSPECCSILCAVPHQLYSP